MNKKGQLTIFMVLGIFILLVSFFIFFIVAKLNSTRLNNQAQNLINNEGFKTVLENYVISCIDIVGKEGLEKIRLSGGNIYDINGDDYYFGRNDYISNFLYDDSIQNVSYIIKNEITTPVYPCVNNKKFDNNRYFCDYNSAEKNNFISFGEIVANRPDILENSIDKQLAKYVEKNIGSCLDYSFFEETLGQKIDFGIPKANVIFGLDSAHITLSYNIGVSINGDVGYAFENFDSQIPTRLKTIYKEIIYSYDSPIKKEVEDANYDLLKKLRYYISYKDLKYDVEIIKDKVSNKGDYILVFKDKLFLDSDKTTDYLFGIENRPPALETIHFSSLDLNGDLYDIVGNNNITIRFKAVDPDDNFISYSFDGFNFDYEVIVENSNCDIKKNNLIRKENKWDQKSSYITYKWNDDEKYCSINLDEPLYVKVRASDGFLTDYQVVNIISMDIPFTPSPIIESINKYECDVDCDYKNGNLILSKEDPYEFMQDGIETDKKLIWLFNNNEFFKTSLMISVFPYDVENKHSYFNIYELKDNSNYFFNDEINNIIKIDDNYISLKEEDSINSPKNFETEIEVVDCIPHRSVEPPFPFNLGTISSNYENELYSFDVLMGNHTCCGNDFKVKDKDIKCYESQEIICGYYDTFTNQYSNKYLNISYKGTCDGIRGNICIPGIPEISRNVYNEFLDDDFNLISEKITCGDELDYSNNKIARCSACAENVNNLGEVNSQEFMGCYYFDEYESYEKNVLLKISGFDTSFYEDKNILEPIERGICAINKKYNSDSMVCNMTCDGLGGCNKPISGECICDKNNDCQGKIPGDRLSSHSKNPIYQDMCDNNCDVVSDMSKIDFSITNTNCDVECDGKIPGSTLTDMCLNNKQVRCNDLGKIEEIPNVCCFNTFSPSYSGNDFCQGKIINSEINFNSCPLDDNRDAYIIKPFCNANCELETNSNSECFSCNYIENNIVKSNGVNACDGFLPDSQTHTCGIDSYGKPYLDFCNQNCEMQTLTQDIGGEEKPVCSSNEDYLNCNGDSECNNKPINYIFSDEIHMCDSMCNYVLIS
jgi:hypothetical protein